LIAWLAMAAMWLVIAAPVISQVVQARSAFAELNTWCDAGIGLSDHGSAPDQHPADHMAACGYCGLLGHAPTMPGAIHVAMFVPSTPTWAVPLPVTSLPAAAHTLAAAPRGPPVFLHA
jgi:hypothetical protein